MRTVAAVLLSLTLLPVPQVATQSKVPLPASAIPNPGRERQLRAAIAAGTATKGTYLELAQWANLRNSYDDTVEALRGAAALDATPAWAQHGIGSFCLDYAVRNQGIDRASKLRYVRDGISFEDRALALDGTLSYASANKVTLLRMQARLTDDPAERARLTADADALHGRLKETPRATTGIVQRDPFPPFGGFSETFEQTLTRLSPLPVGGNIRQPQRARDTLPEYPNDTLAMRAHVEGVVVLDVIIDESGAVANARPSRSIPPLDGAALATVSEWRFVPSDANGKPVSVKTSLKVVFCCR